jgi:hypothetical protein
MRFFRTFLKTFVVTSICATAAVRNPPKAPSRARMVKPRQPVVAAPVRPSLPEFLTRFTLDETQAEVKQMIGVPRNVGDFGAYQGWNYQIDLHDNHEFSHYLVFHKDSGEFVSITQNFEEPQDASKLFPGSLATYYYPDREKPQFRVLVRQLGRGRLLLGMGMEEPRDKASQLMLIRRSYLGFFLPWLEEQMKASSSAPAESR